MIPCLLVEHFSLVPVRIRVPARQLQLVESAVSSRQHPFPARRNRGGCVKTFRVVTSYSRGAATREAIRLLPDTSARRLFFARWLAPREFRSLYSKTSPSRATQDPPSVTSAPENRKLARSAPLSPLVTRFYSFRCSSPGCCP